ncbi:hypothetical protein TEA_002033 [Camellia sinensis var. sinensis]|uniref:TF-B3 domain-containing protein n=1 Tax=Camellia sinensis var. sinensis TaxID=542762 RepID=A0A4S4D338_CAMSN|nr:hypothetical protein TEA_002033 [Camellia sinensis var. sinensis]
MSAYEKELFSNTDVTSNLEIPQSALYLPDAVEDNEIMLAWDHGKIWRFKAPLRRDGTGRRYMSCQWRQFAKDNSLMDRDVVKFYRSTSIVNLYVVSFERCVRGSWTASLISCICASNPPMSAYEKELFSKTDVTGNLEIPRSASALYLPDVAEDNDIMLVWDHGKIWRFKAPLRRDGTGRRYMSCQWRQFAKDNSLMDRDVVKFYAVPFERALRALPLFPGAPL